MSCKNFEMYQRAVPDGKNISIPMAVIQGKNKGPNVGIVAAVHGCEFCGVEALIRIYQEIDPEKLSGTIRMVFVANMPAFVTKTPYKCPIDGGNVGRAFPGKLKGTYTELIGYTIWNKIIDPSDYVFDLHGGDLIEVLTPYVGYNTVADGALNKKAAEIADIFDAVNVEVRPAPDKTEGMAVSEAAPKFGKVGLLVEAGSQGRRDEVDVLFHYNGLMNVFKHLKMIDGDLVKTKKETRYMDQFIGVVNNSEGIFYPLVEAGEVVAEKQRIAAIKSFTGETLEEIF